MANNVQVKDVNISSFLWLATMAKGSAGQVPHYDTWRLGLYVLLIGVEGTQGTEFLKLSDAQREALRQAKERGSLNAVLRVCEHMLAYRVMTGCDDIEASFLESYQMLKEEDVEKEFQQLFGAKWHEWDESVMLKAMHAILDPFLFDDKDDVDIVQWLNDPIMFGKAEFGSFCGFMFSGLLPHRGPRVPMVRKKMGQSGLSEGVLKGTNKSGSASESRKRELGASKAKETIEYDKDLDYAGDFIREVLFFTISTNSEAIYKYQSQWNHFVLLAFRYGYLSPKIIKIVCQYKLLLDMNPHYLLDEKNGNDNAAIEYFDTWVAIIGELVLKTCKQSVVAGEKGRKKTKANRRTIRKKLSNKEVVVKAGACVINSIVNKLFELVLAGEVAGLQEKIVEMGVSEKASIDWAQMLLEKTAAVCEYIDH